MQPLILQHKLGPAPRPGRTEALADAPYTGRSSTCVLTAARANSHSQASISNSSALRSPPQTRMATSAVAERLADPQQTSFTTVPVDLGDRSYPIHIGSDLLREGHKLADMITGSTALIVTNTTIAPLYLQRYATDRWSHTCSLPV